MALDRDQRLERLRVRLEELAHWRDRATVTVEGWLWNGRPLAVGAAWPARVPVAALACPRAAVPDGWPLAEARLELELGGEALVRILGSDGERRSFGLDPWHRRLPLPSRCFGVAAEVVPHGPFGTPRPRPALSLARLVWPEAGLERLLRRLRLCAGAVEALGAEDAAGALLAAAERALTRLDWPSASGPYLARTASGASSLWSPAPAFQPEPLAEPARRSVAAALADLDGELRRLRAAHPRRGRLAVAGHAHLDLAWLWPLEETRRKVQRTFHTALGLLERYPELTFAQSSAELYRLAQEDDPELFEAVRAAVGAGRWEPVGGMWVEADMNMPAGESIVRQLLEGQRFFERELGARHRVAWLPDCFGFTPALPQLLRQAGIEALVTCKLSWSETNPFPLDLFWWEGLDGSRVLAHGFGSSPPSAPAGLGLYNGDPAPATLVGAWNGFRGRRQYPECLFTIGYGDGGGGPNAEMLEEIRELGPFPALPELTFTRVGDYFDRLLAAAPGLELPGWSGELYLELHRGTLTSQGRTKHAHRRAERDLVAAEVAGCLCRLCGGPAPGVDLGPAWRLVLRNQFHDILPGSGIAEVYRRAEAELAEAAATAGAAIRAAVAGLAGAVAPPGDAPAALVLNPDLSRRPLRAVLPAPLPGAQPVEDGWALSGPMELAGLEVAVLTRGEPAAAARATPQRLENELVRVELADDGSLASVFDLSAGREALAGPGNQLWAYVDKPRAWDAWDVDAGYADQGEALGRPLGVEVVEPGPHRAAIRIHRRHRSSLVTQTVRVWAGSARIDFVTQLDWHDRRLLLKARFPLAVRSARATFETAFGVVERPTHRNTSWDAARFEVAGHRFADLSEPGYGVALLNDGRHGYHALGSELGLSLLRSPVHPDPLADEGVQRLTYSLLPHSGSWLEGGVLMEAEDLNRPLLVGSCRAGGPVRRRPLAVEGPPLGLGALKPALVGGGLVLRVYEPQGGRGRARVEVAAGWELAGELNLLEDRLGPADLDFAPFQVRSLLLRPVGAAGPAG